MMRQTDFMRDSLGDIFLIIERTQRLDPEAFTRHIGEDGMPGPFVNPDDSRRFAAYQKACAEVSESLRNDGRPLFRHH